VGIISLGFVTFDCPDPRALSTFYARLLGWPEDPEPAPDNFFAELADPRGGVGLSFQRVDGYRAPEWPGQIVPQQLHLSLLTHDPEAAHLRALELGARPLADQDELRVYADPAGHPFCISATTTGSVR
jgi:catechol 2,3-dioxygenase-like lactoylglutathione lyase family enzyme